MKGGNQTLKGSTPPTHYYLSLPVAPSRCVPLAAALHATEQCVWSALPLRNSALIGTAPGIPASGKVSSWWEDSWHDGDDRGARARMDRVSRPAAAPPSARPRTRLMHRIRFQHLDTIICRPGSSARRPNRQVWVYPHPNPRARAFAASHTRGRHSCRRPLANEVSRHRRTVCFNAAAVAAAACVSFALLQTLGRPAACGPDFP